MSTRPFPQHDEVISFIRHFAGAEKVFLEGCCYWFAYILCSRFGGSEIWYDCVDNHFVARIDDRYYDVTGEVHGQFVSWSEYAASDPVHANRIIQACVLKK